MKCQNCGAEVIGNYCSYCGSKADKQKPTVNVVINNVPTKENTDKQLLYFNNCDEYMASKNVDIKPKLYNSAVKFILDTEKIFYIGLAGAPSANGTKQGVLIVTDEKVLYNYKKEKIIMPISDILSVIVKKGAFGILRIIIEASSYSHSFICPEAEIIKQSINGAITYNKEQKRSNNTYVNNINAVDNNSSDVDELIEYKRLLDAGAITKEEYETLKKRILGI